MTPDSNYIQNMFDRLAGRYDLFNHFVSLGMATRWRRQTLRPVRPGMRVLDLGCGTGDLALEAARRMGGKGQVIGLDFSDPMLTIARERARRLLPSSDGSIQFIQKKAEELPFETQPYDAVVSGFVLRNLYENIDSILKGVYQSLNEGGVISFLDITEPDNRIWRAVWRVYINSYGALCGKLLFGKDYPLPYLAESAGRFPRASGFVKKLEAAGFRDVRARGFMFGMVTLYQAVK